MLLRRRRALQELVHFTLLGQSQTPFKELYNVPEGQAKYPRFLPAEHITKPWQDLAAMLPLKPPAQHVVDEVGVETGDGTGAGFGAGAGAGAGKGGRTGAGAEGEDGVKVTSAQFQNLSPDPGVAHTPSPLL